MSNSIQRFFSDLFARLGGAQPAAPATPPSGSVDPVHPKVLLVVFNPTVPSEGGRKLIDLLNWSDTGQLVKQYIADVKDASYGYCNYQVVERVEVDAWPLKADGFLYSGDSFVEAWRARSGFHQPDWMDYDRIMADYNLAERIANGEIDEVWLFAGPYGGFYESRMVGPGAFWCNAPPLEGYDHASRRFVIMGFNYERGVGEMLEAHGHRAESIMRHVYRDKRGKNNQWKRFTRYDKTHPGKAEVGIVHFAPNSQKDYDWGNRAKVPSRCDSWLNFPDLSDSSRVMDCSEWGNGDIRLHHIWWFKHFPHVPGTTGGISNNWWEYVTDPNHVR